MKTLYPCLSVSLLTILFTLFIVPTPPLSATSRTDTLFQQANEAYSRSEYQKAAGQYRQIVADEGYSSAVLINLANSYAHTGETGRAILNYERALRLEPSNSDIISNLNLVRKKSGLFPGESTWTARITDIFNLDQWTTLAFFALFCFTLSQLATMKRHVSWRLTTGVAAASVLVFCLATTAATLRYQYFNPSVVTSPKARLLISPFESSASIGSIQEGRLIFPEKIHGNYTYVTDETNRKGWLYSPFIEAVNKKSGTSH